MKRLYQSASLAALALVLVPSLLYFASTMELGSVKTAMLCGTLLWFISAPLWMEHGHG